MQKDLDELPRTSGFYHSHMRPYVGRKQRGAATLAASRRYPNAWREIVRDDHGKPPASARNRRISSRAFAAYGKTHRHRRSRWPPGTRSRSESPQHRLCNSATWSKRRSRAGVGGGFRRTGKLGLRALYHALSDWNGFGRRHLRTLATYAPLRQRQALFAGGAASVGGMTAAMSSPT
jgi:hypothetical protein